MINKGRGIYLLTLIDIARVIIIIEMSTKKASGLKYFSEESSGFKIQPKTVLIMSLIYIGLVVLLHIYAKLGATKPATIESPEPATEAPSASAEQPEAEPQ
jgi:preprotein translocase subunit Sec61beta